MIMMMIFTMSRIITTDQILSSRRKYLLRLEISTDKEPTQWLLLRQKLEKEKLPALYRHLNVTANSHLIVE